MRDKTPLNNAMKMTKVTAKNTVYCRKPPGNFSFSFSMIVFGIKYLYKRVTKKEDKRKGFAKEIMESIYPKQSSTLQSSGFHLEGHPATESQNISNSQELTNGDEEKKEVEMPDAWKDRIQN